MNRRDRIKKVVREGVDAYEDYSRGKDDAVFVHVSQGLEALSSPATLLKWIYILAACNTVLLLGVLFFPVKIYIFFRDSFAASDKMTMVLLGVPFGVGMWLVYSLLRLKYPDIEEQNLDNEVLATFAYQAHSNKRWFVWLGSIIGGIMNVLILTILDLLLAGR